MLQTIYETESCFSTSGADSHQPLELLRDNDRGSGAAVPTTGESSLGEQREGGARTETQLQQQQLYSGTPAFGHVVAQAHTKDSFVLGPQRCVLQSRV